MTISEMIASFQAGAIGVMASSSARQSGVRQAASFDLRLLQMPGLSEAAIIGVADAKWGERPLAILVAREGGSIDNAAVQQHVKTYAEKGVISRFAIPDKIRFVDAIEKTSVGKIDKKVLRAKYGDG